MFFRPLAFLLATAVALGATAGKTRATVMVEVLVEDLVRDADAIVVGRVSRSGERLELLPGGGMEVHTVTTLEVSEWLKADGLAARALTIDEFGGEAQGVGMRIDGVPTYGVGEEVVVFLERHGPQRASYRTLAMAQGKFSIRRGIGGVPATVRRDLSTVGFARWNDGRMQVARGEAAAAMELESFLTLVRDVLSLGRAE
jgi:hypothetical protein